MIDIGDFVTIDEPGLGEAYREGHVIGESLTGYWVEYGGKSTPSYLRRRVNWQYGSPIPLSSIVKVERMRVSGGEVVWEVVWSR